MRFDRHDEIYHFRHTLFFSFLFVMGGVKCSGGGAGWDAEFLSNYLGKLSFSRTRQAEKRLTEIKTKMKTKTKTKRVKLPTGGALRAPLAGSPAFVFVFVFIVVLLSVKFFGPQLIRENLNFSQQIDQILTSNPTQPPPHLTPPIKKKRKKRSVSKMKDQVVTIKTHTESSKSELSSGTFDHVKVCKKFWGLSNRSKLSNISNTRFIDRIDRRPP